MLRDPSTASKYDWPGHGQIVVVNPQDEAYGERWARRNGYEQCYLYGDAPAGFVHILDMDRVGDRVGIYPISEKPARFKPMESVTWLTH